MLLPHIKRNRLKPVVSVNLRDMVFIRSEGLSVEPGGILRLDAGQIDGSWSSAGGRTNWPQGTNTSPGTSCPCASSRLPKVYWCSAAATSEGKGPKTSISPAGELFLDARASGPVRQYRVDSPSGRLYGLTDTVFRKEAETGRYIFDLFDAYADIGASEKKDGCWNSPRTWPLPIRNTAAWRTSPAAGRKGTTGISAGCSPCRSTSTGTSSSIRLSLPFPVQGIRQEDG